MKKNTIILFSALLAVILTVVFAMPVSAAETADEAKASTLAAFTGVTPRSYVADTSYENISFVSDGEYLYAALTRSKSNGTCILVSLDGGDSLSEKTIAVYINTNSTYGVAWPKNGTISYYRFGDHTTGLSGIVEGFYAFFVSSSNTAYTAYARIPLSYFSITEAPAKISTYEVDSTWAEENNPAAWTKLNQGDSGYKTLHKHEWIYSATGGVITATCTNEKTACNNKVNTVLTLIAPENNNTFWTEKSAEATFDKDALAGLETLPVIHYVGINGTTYPDSTTPPTARGEYMAYATVSFGESSSATAMVPYSIKFSLYQGSPDCSVNLNKTNNGTLTANTGTAFWGREVLITATPAFGYRLAALSVIDENGDTVEVTQKVHNLYHFTMPQYAVTVTAIYEKKPACTKDSACLAAAFDDMDPKEWYHDGVHFCLEEGLLEGDIATAFSPNKNLTRAAMITMLWKLENSPKVDANLTFADVRAGSSYENAVRWASANGIVNGYDADTFAPDRDVNREEFVAILFRYANFKGYSTDVRADLSKFVDASTVETWALDSVKWATAAELLIGKGDAVLDPLGTATRAEAATMVYRFCEKIAK